MIRSGITCFADMYYFEEAVAAAAAEAGLRAFCAQTVLRFPSPDAASFEDGLARARAFIEEWKGHPLIVPGPAPHAPYTCTPEILRACAELAAEFDVPLHIHLSETLLEVEESRRVNGMPVIPWVKKQGLFGAKVLAAHCVHVDEGEMRALKNFDAGVAHNPTSNLKLAAGIAPIAKMRELGLAVGIGTDGAASNNDLDMFEETRLAALLAKGSTGDPRACPRARRSRWRRAWAPAPCTWTRSPDRSSPASGPISSCSTWPPSTTSPPSDAIRLASTPRSSMRRNPPTSST
jgi:5-methylthioadenosine/S-adenosylhomocysteine deaminase